MIEATYKPDGDGSTQQKLTDDQIVAHSVTFMLAGYETTSTALSYVSYLLALNPTIQERLQQEIDDYFQNNPVRVMYLLTINYLTLLRLFYYLYYLATLSYQSQIEISTLPQERSILRCCSGDRVPGQGAAGITQTPLTRRSVCHIALTPRAA